MQFNHTTSNTVIEHDSISLEKTDEMILLEAPMTIDGLINLGLRFHDHKFYFYDTLTTVDELHCWRGDYEKPAISFYPFDKTGGNLAHDLLSDLDKVHTGYKGGEYFLYGCDEFYVVENKSSPNNMKVIGYDISTGVIKLLTKLM